MHFSFPVCFWSCCAALSVPHSSSIKNPKTINNTAQSPTGESYHSRLSEKVQHENVIIVAQHHPRAVEVSTTGSHKLQSRGVLNRGLIEAKSPTNGGHRHWIPHQQWHNQADAFCREYDSYSLPQGQRVETDYDVTPTNQKNEEKKGAGYIRCNLMRTFAISPCVVL